MKIAILYVCTGKYIRFWDEFYKTAERHFFPGVEKHYFVFTDQEFPESVLPNVSKVEQENLGWPDNTLRRFHMFLKVESELELHDYLYFFNANCRFKKDIGKEFLPEQNDQLLVVRHPGQLNKPESELPYERNPRSRACIPFGRGRDYVCGGVNGGSSHAFLRFANTARDAIDADYRDGIVAQWHDESHINRYIIDNPFSIRSASYCYPQNWRLDEDVIIEVRDKQNHGGRDSLRSLGAKLQSEDMVTVAIYGGLGNQMFQYAAGRALALRNSCRLQLDTRHYDTQQAFRYGLGDFKIQAIIGTSRTLPPNKDRRLRYLAWRHFSNRHRLLREKGLAFNSDIATAKGSLYLRGYWQSEKYFADAVETIRHDLQFMEPPIGENLDFLEEIKQSNSIALHVRRGDYVSNPKSNAFHGTCSPEYYRGAVEQILETTGRDHTVYLFSDDCQWARKNISVPCKVRIVDHNDIQTAHEDMRLMSSCRHQVASNSTFSWWAGWLNPNPAKIVIVPHQWFADPTADDSDIIPTGWRQYSPALPGSEVKVA
jgi:hypothetical protein